MKLFRNFRIKSLKTNKASKYLIYALGEVLLIVAGLFIAVQLNNWNEDKKYDKRTDRLLRLMQGELRSNITYANYFIPYYQKQDSVVTKVVSGDLTVEDYKKNENILADVFINVAYPFNKNTFTELNEHIDEVPQELAQIYSFLRYIYISLYDTNEKSSKILTEFLIERNKNLMKTKPWAHKRFEEDFPDEFYDYLVNDPFFKNEAAEFRNLTYSYEHFTIEYVKNYSIETYVMIENYLRKKSGNEEIYKFYKKENFKNVVGDYRSEKDSMKTSITFDDKGLLYKEENEKASRFHFVNDSTYTSNDGFYFFTWKQKDSATVSLKKQHGTENILFKKL